MKRKRPFLVSRGPFLLLTCPLPEHSINTDLVYMKRFFLRRSSIAYTFFTGTVITKNYPPGWLFLYMILIHMLPLLLIGRLMSIWIFMISLNALVVLMHFISILLSLPYFLKAKSGDLELLNSNRRTISRNFLFDVSKYIVLPLVITLLL